MGSDAAYEEGVGQIPQQGGPQADSRATTKRAVRRLSLPPAELFNGGGGIAGGGYLRLPSPEHSSAIYFD